MKDATEYCGIVVIAAACGYWLLAQLGEQFTDLLNQTVEMLVSH